MQTGTRFRLQQVQQFFHHVGLKKRRLQRAHDGSHRRLLAAERPQTVASNPTTDRTSSASLGCETSAAGVSDTLAGCIAGRIGTLRAPVDVTTSQADAKNMAASRYGLRNPSGKDARDQKQFPAPARCIPRSGCTAACQCARPYQRLSALGAAGGANHWSRATSFAVAGSPR
jgi:hypothetical protein